MYDIKRRFTMVKVSTVTVGPIQTNCYIVYTGKNQGIIIDPGFEAGRIKDRVKALNVVPEAVLLTHGHFDHISAAEEMRSTYGVKIYASVLEKETLQDINMNLTYEATGNPVSLHGDEFLNDGEEISPAGIKIRCISTPGHTCGGMCFFLPDDGVLFSGDTLFRGSCGRTDFPGGSEKDIISSIRDKLFVLPEDTKVFPGHGEPTSIAYEKKNNKERYSVRK